MEDELVRGYDYTYMWVDGNNLGIRLSRKSGFDGEKILVKSGNYR